jgi:hypothetical protein
VESTFLVLLVAGFVLLAGVAGYAALKLARNPAKPHSKPSL